MLPRTTLSALVAATMAALLTPALAAADPAGSTSLISRPSGLGVFGPGSVNVSDAGQRAVSADGCRVVFTSAADGLEPGTADDATTHVFVRDRCAGTTKLVSRSTGGTLANQVSTAPTISADGKKVAYVSYATSLVTPAPSGGPFIYVTDLDSGETVLASKADAPLSVTYSNSRFALDGTGRRLVFITTSRAEPAVDENSSADAYVKDLQDGSLRVASVADTAAGKATGSVIDVAISDDGSTVGFVTLGIDGNGSYDAYTRSGTATTLVSVKTTGGAAGVVEAVDLSADGGAAVFATQADDGADTNGSVDVYRRAGTTTTWISQRPAGSGFGAASKPAISGDGTKVAYATQAAVVAGDTNGWDDVVVRDVAAGTSVIASRAAGAGGALGDQRSSSNAWPSLDGDGSVVAFETIARNLVADGDPDFRKVLARDLTSHATELLSRPTGTGGTFKSGVNGITTQTVGDGSMSADGRYVVFASRSDALSDADDDRYLNVFVRDTKLDTTTLVGPVGHDDVYASPVISADGRRVAWVSHTPLAGDDDRNGVSDVYVKDLESGEVTLASRGSGGAVGVYVTSHDGIALDADGSRVAFITTANIGSDTNSSADVYVRDLDAATTHLASASASGAPAGNAVSPSLDGPGDTVAFTTTASLVAADTGTIRDVYVRELGDGTTHLISRTAAGAGGNGTSSETSISADGRRVAFTSQATNLHPNDLTANSTAYVRDRDDDAAGNKMLSPGTGGNAGWVALSDDGSALGFATTAGLVAGDTDGERDVYVRAVDGQTVTWVSRGDGVDGAEHRPAAATSPALNATGTCVSFNGFVGTFTPEQVATADFSQIYKRVISGECPDETAPDTTITDRPDRHVNATTASFGFAETPGENGAEFECRLDGGWERCEAPHELTGLAEGEHEFEVRAFDAAENRDATPATWTFTVDLTAPQTTVAGPEGRTNDASPTFTFGADEDARFLCDVDGGGFEDCDAPSIELEGLNEGTHTFAVKAVDLAGNEDASAATRTFTIDTTGPSASITGVTASDDGRATATFTASEGGATLECAVDAGAFAACASPKELSGLGAGAHTLKVRALDDLGNRGEVVSRTFTVPAKPKPQTGAGVPSGAGAAGGGATGGSLPSTSAPRGTGDDAPRPVAAVTLAGRSAKVKRGRVTLTLVCAGAECRGTLVLQAKIGRKTVVLGKATYWVKAGKRVKATVKLTAAGRKAVKRGKRVKATVRLGGATTPLTLRG